MEFYCESLEQYKRLATKEVKIGELLLGNFHPIRVQTMTTTDTMDTKATVEQSIRCIEAGAELIRITAPSKNDAENLLNIKNELRNRGYNTPIVADIHFTPNAAEIAARIVEKVRINPGNYIDKKKFQLLEYTDAQYNEEIERIRERFTPLIKICKEYGTAMRIGTNHGSLSDRIMSRYGDTPMGMVESAMEFLRIARNENYHQIVLSMKASNPLVMVQAYRLLVKTMHEEFSECYPLHLGVTEAGDGEDGRIKSSVGIGALLEDGLGDTIRVSLTEDPEFEIPVCKDLVKRYSVGNSQLAIDSNLRIPEIQTAKYRLPYSPFEYKRRETFEVGNIGGKHVPVVIADLSTIGKITNEDLKNIGYEYDEKTGKWNKSDAAADYVFVGKNEIGFQLPDNLKVITTSKHYDGKKNYFPFFSFNEYLLTSKKSELINFVKIECFDKEAVFNSDELEKIKNDKTVVLCLISSGKNAMRSVRRMYIELMDRDIRNPVINMVNSDWKTGEENLIHYAAEAGALFLDGFGDGIFLDNTSRSLNHKQLNSIAFGILQATRTRISKTEYISCPSCGRTLFELQATTARIRAMTNHLKGVKIAVMGCIVNGPGEMADADFGYVGSGPGKITLYKGKEIVKRNVNTDIAVEELINLLKEHNAWIEP